MIYQAKEDKGSSSQFCFQHSTLASDLRSGAISRRRKPPSLARNAAQSLPFTTAVVPLPAFALQAWFRSECNVKRTSWVPAERRCVIAAIARPHAMEWGLLQARRDVLPPRQTSDLERARGHLSYQRRQPASGSPATPPPRVSAALHQPLPSRRAVAVCSAEQGGCGGRPSQRGEGYRQDVRESGGSDAPCRRRRC